MDGYIRVRVLLTAPPTASPRPLATTENEHWTQPKTKTKTTGHIASYRRLDIYRASLKTDRPCAYLRIVVAIMNALKLIDCDGLDCKVKR